MQMVAATMCGLIFGWGLLISMAAALAVSSIGFRYAASRACPVLAPKSLWPSRTEIDPPLVIGAMLFGIGWGLVGLCPGPALENLATLSPRVIVFVVAMAFGMVLHRIWQKRGAGPERLHAPTAVLIDG